MSNSKLSVQNLFYTFPDGTEALRNINLDIEPNQVYVIFGPSRSGKTTLLRQLNRLADLTEGAQRQGKILFNGQNIFARRVDVIQLRRKISMVFAIPTPLPGSIFDNMSYGLRMAGIKDKQEVFERVERGLRQAALWEEVVDRLDQSAFALSGGQKQRLCIARCLALEPDVLLLDNPTSGLDPLSTSIVENSLAELKNKYTIIIVPHSVQQAARIADKATFLLNGEVIESGDQRQIFLDPQHKRTIDYVTGRFG